LNAIYWEIYTDFPDNPIYVSSISILYLIKMIN